MKKKISVIFLLCLLIMCISACSNSKKTGDNKDDNKKTGNVEVRVGSLKGPTSIGLVNLMKDSEEGKTEGKYSFKISGQADEITSMLVSGELDVALIPANAASILYNKTNNIEVLDINTLGVLYCVTGDESISSINDLEGKNVISMGQGTTPEFVFRYLLKESGVKKCDITFVSEANEAAALLMEDPKRIAILPQPFTTVAIKKNDKIKEVFSLTDEWKRLSGNDSFVTGVTVVRKDFLQDNKDAVLLFMEEQKKSTESLSDVKKSADLVVEKGIIENAAIAEEAIPKCNITYIDGDEMKKNLSEYLKVLYDNSPEAVGGKLPEEDFYFAK